MGAEHGTQTADPMAMFAEMGKPTKNHELIKQFEGTFKSTVKMWMGPGDPMVSTGVMVNTMVLNGLYLQHEYKGDPNPGPFPSFAGKGFFGFNKRTNQFEGLWIDTACSWMGVEKGQVDGAGKVWTMYEDTTDPMTGKPMKKKSIIKVLDKDRHSMEMFFQQAGQPEHKCMEIQYVRK